MDHHFSGERKSSWSSQTQMRKWFERRLDFMDAHPLHVLGLILVLSILVSLFFNRDSLPPAENAGENDTWWAIARNLVHGEGYSLCLTSYFPFCGPSNQATATREPLPVLFFAGIAFLSRESLWVAVAAELLIDLAILVAVYFLTREWSTSRAALLAAFLWAIYIPAHQLISQVSGDLLAAFLVTTGLLFVMRARRTRNLLDWSIAGASLGLAAISRSGTLVVAVVLIGGLIVEAWRRRFHRKQTLAPVLILSGLVVLFMAPWLIRNTIVFGRPIFGSSLIGYNLYRHNHMIGTHDYLRHVGGPEGWEVTQALLTRRTDLTGAENEAQMDRVYFEEAFRLIRAHPAQYALLSAYRFLPLWFNWGYREAYGKEPVTTDYAIMILQGMLLILALVSLPQSFRRAWPLWGGILALCLSYMAVDSRLLYLIPVMPFVVSLSADGGIKILGKIFPDRFAVQK